MFPLKERKISGYRFGQATSYSVHHLGTDYRAVYNDLYAPFDGRVERHDGKEGGITLWFYPHGQLPVMRFMHLDQVFEVGEVKEGERMAMTGNSGSLSASPHLHLDISNTDQGTYWTNFNNFIDPELFNWNKEEKMFTDLEVKYIKDNINDGNEYVAQNGWELVAEAIVHAKNNFTAFEKKIDELVKEIAKLKGQQVSDKDLAFIKALKEVVKE